MKIKISYLTLIFSLFALGIIIFEVSFQKDYLNLKLGIDEVKLKLSKIKAFNKKVDIEKTDFPIEELELTFSANKGGDIFKLPNLVYDGDPNYLLVQGIKQSPWTGLNVLSQEDIKALKHQEYLKKDSDNGGLINDLELKLFLDPEDPNDDNLDYDNDGFLNLEELSSGTKLDDARDHPSLVKLLKIKNVSIGYVPFTLKNIVVKNFSPKKDWDISIQNISTKKLYFIRQGYNIELLNISFYVKDVFYNSVDKTQNYILLDTFEQKTNKLIQSVKMYTDKKELLLYRFKVSLVNVSNEDKVIELEALNQEFSLQIKSSLEEKFRLSKIISPEEIEVYSLKDKRYYRVK